MEKQDSPCINTEVHGQTLVNFWLKNKILKLFYFYVCARFDDIMALLKAQSVDTKKVCVAYPRVLSKCDAH